MAPSHHAHLGYWSETLLHPLKVMAMMLPWSLLALVSLRPRFARLWDDRGQRLLQALHCWTWPNLLFWSLVPQHSTRHCIPLAPGLMGLAALVWIAWLDGRLWFRTPDFPSAKRLPMTLLAGFVGLWLVVKVAFVYAVLPQRTAERDTRAKGERLAALVPPGQTLYLCRVKDEGLMFYYGRPVRRLTGWSALPTNTGLAYGIVEDTEWKHWPASIAAEVVQRMTDEQGAPIVLVRIQQP
jgi:hypothetical protein